MSEEIHLVALFYPAPGKLERATELFRMLSKKVHENEPGALRYMMTTEVDTDDPVIAMFETYKDRQAAKDHNETSYFKEVYDIAIKEELAAKPSVILLTSLTTGFDLDRKLI